MDCQRAFTEAPHFEVLLGAAAVKIAVLKRTTIRRFIAYANTAFIPHVESCLTQGADQTDLESQGVR